MHTRFYSALSLGQILSPHSCQTLAKHPATLGVFAEAFEDYWLIEPALPGQMICRLGGRRYTCFPPLCGSMLKFPASSPDLSGQLLAPTGRAQSWLTESCARVLSAGGWIRVCCGHCVCVCYDDPASSTPDRCLCHPRLLITLRLVVQVGVIACRMVFTPCLRCGATIATCGTPTRLTTWRSAIARTSARRRFVHGLRAP